MSIKKYKFVSPGVQTSEVDNSQLPAVADDVGALIIGRALRGPAMRPVEVSSFSDFVNIFGNPAPGGVGVDAWRYKDQSAPTYGMYAAQAYLKSNSPLTYVRLLGEEHPRKTSGGEAGWMTRASNGNANLVGSDGGGAYGLFVVPSASFSTADSVTGSLAAVWYCNSGWVRLSGTMAGTAASATASLGVYINSQANDKAFTAEVVNSSGVATDKITFNFNPSSDKFIRKVFNTNPTLVNSNLTNNVKTYHLGETFERHIIERFERNGVEVSTNDSFGVILPLKLSDTSQGIEQADMRFGTQAAKTGWFFSQDLTVVTNSTLSSPVANNYTHDGMQKLFRFVTLDTGEWDQTNLKISIADVRAPQNDFNAYGTFTVQLRKIEDKDNSVKIVEQYTNCNLDPASPNYVAKKIGNRYTVWDDDENRYREYGDFDNQSRFIRVEMNADVDNATTDTKFLPFGVYGPPRFKAITFSSSSAPSGNIYALSASQTGVPNAPSAADTGDNVLWYPTSCNFTSSFEFPRTYLRVSSSDGDLQSHKSAYFGYDNGRSTTNYVFDESVVDVVRAKPSGIDSYVKSTETEYSWVFTLDDVTQSGSSGTSISPNSRWLSGSRATGISITAISSSYRAVLDAGFDKFTTTLHGGFDGLDIQEAEPFNNTRDLASSATELNSYAYYSVKKAIDTVADSEVVLFDLTAMPGITNTSLNDYLVRVCEDRADALAIIDLPNAYVPRQDNGTTDVRYLPNETITEFRSRGLNSSYGATYYPWVQIRDTINDQVLWAPPSIVAVGVLSNTQKVADPWMAAAGFNRGGLSVGHAGIPVLNVREKLTKKQRDDLYDANINPIAKFPNTGIVVWGQKTLQLTPSALDRINVRRMLLFIKRGISRIADQLLFDQNIETTWSRFRAKADRFLKGVKTRLGIAKFKFVLDKSTTTPDLVDRNILYAKVFVTPVKSIEYIAVDFNITNTGASFAD